MSDSLDVTDTAIPTVVYERFTRSAIAMLKANEKARRVLPQTEVDEDKLPRNHLLPAGEGWQAPSPLLVTAYFNHFKEHFPEYGTDDRLAELLGVSSARRLREYKQGVAKVPYHVWRQFLVMTGRVPPIIPRVFAFMGERDGQRELKI